MARRRGIMESEKVREIIRLTELGCNQTEISKFCKISRSCIQDYQKLCKAVGTTYEEAKLLSDTELKELFGKKQPGRIPKGTNHEPNFLKVKQELNRKGVTLELLWQEWIVENGSSSYSYSTFWRKYRKWERRANVLFKRVYEPGEEGQFDYAGVSVKIYDRNTNEFKECPVFVGALGFSYLKYVEVSENAQIQYWIGSSIRALEYFGGTPKLIVIDNLKTGVNKPCRYEPEINKQYQLFSEHYQTAIIPARVRKPKDKSKVEKAVQDVERWVLAPLRNCVFYSIAQANIAIKAKLEELNNKTLQDYGVSAKELYEKYEKQHLLPLPQHRYQFCTWKQATVSLDYHIQVDYHYYSVPYYLCKSIVNVKVGELKVEIYHDNKQVCAHVKNNTPYRHSTIEAHMPPQHLVVKSWTEENFINWGASAGQEILKQITGLFLSARHKQQAYRSILGLQRLAKMHGNNAVDLACQQANKLGIFSQRYVRTQIQQGLLTATHSNIRGENYFH